MGVSYPWGLVAVGIRVSYPRGLVAVCMRVSYPRGLIAVDILEPGVSGIVVKAFLVDRAAHLDLRLAVSRIEDDRHVAHARNEHFSHDGGST